MILNELKKEKLINPPDWLPANTSYLTYMGSVAYGVAGETSDYDVYGFAIPPKDYIFPNLGGHIPGFGPKPPSFEQYQKHHVQFKEKEYDFTIYNIVKYFELVMGCNPNMIDSIFTPRRCIFHTTEIAEMVRDNRKIFLCSKAYHTFKGYAYAQMTKIENKSNSSNAKRAADVEKNQYDTKFAYHLIRLVDECAQILTEGDLDLERNRDILKSIRAGEFTLERFRDLVVQREKMLSDLFGTTKLPREPRFEEIKALLLNCLEHHYGSLTEVQNVALQIPNQKSILDDLKELIRKYE